MKILITGSAGFVGGHLIKRLSDGNEIVKYDLVNRQNVLDGRLLSQKLKGVDLVIHLAAFISATESWDKPMEYIRNNALGTLSVVKCAIKEGVKKMIFFSSAAVKVKPLTPYAISKINAENILELYKNDLNITIIRPENIYGSGQKEAYGYVIHNFIKAVKGGKEISIYGDGRQTRDFIYIDDVVKIVEGITRREIKSGTVINLGTGKEVKIINLAKEVMNIIGKKTNIKYLDARTEPRKSVASLASMKSAKINFKNFINLKTGIRKVLNLQYS